MDATRPIRWLGKRPRAIGVAAAPWLIGLSAAWATAQPIDPPRYLEPPETIVDILDARPLPSVALSPTMDTVALLERRPMPAIAELARPQLRLAGHRINPSTHGPHRESGIDRILLKRVADGSERIVALPAGASVDSVRYAPDGSRLAFTLTREAAIELWVADPRSGQARALTEGSLNATWGDPCEWLDADRLLCSFVSGRPAPPAPRAPAGPNVQAHAGGPAPVRTFQDLLESSHDEALFEHHFTRQLATVDAATGERVDVGAPGLFEVASASPNGSYLLVGRLERPFSRLVRAGSFPKRFEVWDLDGTVVTEVARLPLADAVPIGGVPTGPRRVSWDPTRPATLVWAEALDGGDPSVEVPHRDRLLTLTVPVDGRPVELVRTEFRFTGVDWTESGVALVRENDRATRWTRTWLVERDGSRRPLWDRSREDRYGDPGVPIPRPSGRDTSGFGRRDGEVVLQHGDWIFLAGPGASPQGDRPFVDRLNLSSLVTERRFRSGTTAYETLIGPLSADASLLLTRHETATTPPNYRIRDLAADSSRPLTDYPNPAPQLAGVTKQLITYERADGIGLSGTLYLPPGYEAPERVPMVMWAYPREFTDPGAAGQVRGSANRFPTIRGASHLLLLTEGYAIFDDPTMPIVGAGETANDDYVEQLVASAEAAIEAVVALGVTDRDRIAIGGHSYGAFMAANLLAHSDLFQAGIARSGAYNRTLTPFGFQNERRTFWEVPDVYGRMSPFFHADKVNEPILLTHGELDNNSGTFPIQSERFYMALKGHGATVRYVTLPYESHGYAARESILHVVAEMLAWCQQYLPATPVVSVTDPAIER